MKAVQLSTLLFNKVLFDVTQVAFSYPLSLLSGIIYT